MMSKKRYVVPLVMGLTLLMLMHSEAASPPPENAKDREEKSKNDFQAERLVAKAEELLALHEYDRGVKMLETVIDQFPNSPIRYKACLALGQHFIDVQKYSDAIRRLRGLKPLYDSEKELTGDAREWVLESQYLTGVAYFHMRDYGNAFTTLRKITRDYPNSIWANQSYYYIGMCHFALQNWNKAVEALSMVGTFIDPDSPNIDLTEAGRRFYVKVDDGDIPILFRTGKDIKVQVSTRSGDEEIINCVPFSDSEPIALSSIPTTPGTAKPGDHILQIVGGDEITVKYYDGNTLDGRKDVLRQKRVKVVSSATVDFTLGTFDSGATAAFLGQPVFILVKDLDGDISPAADQVKIRVVSRYKVKDEGAEGLGTVDVSRLYLEAEEQSYEIRDEITLSLKELGDPPVHSGQFGGSVDIQPVIEGTPADKFDDVLSCTLDDEVVAFYVDERHIKGESKKEIVAKTKVVGEVDGRPIATQTLVSDTTIKAKKQIIEATAYLELTRIFKSMGLMKNAVEKSNEGLGRVQDVILEKASIPSNLREKAFKIKWELLIEVEDYSGAVKTCQLFNRLFPESPFADEALMKVGIVQLENNDIRGAIEIFEQILRLQGSQAKAEAQFRIAEALSRQPHTKGQAMQAFKKCAERYPESPFAGKALGSLVDYYYETKDYTQAEDLLSQIFIDYPDADFLDSMLLKWVIVCFRTGNHEKALEKCNKLLFEYPASEFAAHAKKMLPTIEKKLKEK